MRAHCGWMMQIHNVAERAFYISGAHHCGITCCRVQSDEKKFTQVETTELRLPRHFESHVVINDHRHKGTFTSQQASRSAVYIGVCVYVCVFLCVRICAFSLINGLYYSVLLNFIWSGSPQGVERALSFCLCLCVFFSLCVCLFSSDPQTHIPSNKYTVWLYICWPPADLLTQKSVSRHSSAVRSFTQ